MPARVLVVDDTLPSLKMLAAKLSGEYYEVLTAQDGLEAIDMVARHRPDIVLLDVMMSGLNGYDTCRRLKALRSSAQIPVIMVTALSDVADRIAGLQAGADDFLTKPVNDRTLFARVRSLVRIKNMFDQWRMREETSHMFGLPVAGPVGTDEPGTAGRVLAIADSAVELRNLADVLERDRHRVATRLGCRQTLDPAAVAEMDLVVVALSVDDDEGLRLCSHLRSMDLTRHTPLLLIGDDYDHERLDKGLDLGVNDYVLRPVEDAELLTRARAQVRRKRYHDRLRESFMQSLSLALIDPLTGLHNRRYFDGHLRTLVQRMVDNAKPLTAMMIDIDRFKTVNDTHGHPVGDHVLSAIAQRIAHDVRGVDLAARYGGEEFVVAMPDTDAATGWAVAERLLGNIARLPIAVAGLAEPLAVTVSIGVATMPPDGESAESLIARADKALYAAKQGGRNRVVAG